MVGIAHRPPLLMLSKASRNGLGHLVLPLGFHTTSIITGMPTIARASCTLASAFMFMRTARKTGERLADRRQIDLLKREFSLSSVRLCSVFCASTAARVAHAIDAALRRRHAATALRVVTPCEGSMSATGEPSAKRAKPVDAAAERAHLLTTLLQYQASRKPADDAVGQAEAACEAQLRESLTAAVLQLPPSRVVSKSALAAFKQQHAAMCRVNAAATLTSKMDPASAEAPDAKPPAQADEPVKSEL